MNAERLVQMANDIGRFYDSLPDRAEALGSTANHLRRFWDPRMRAELLEHIEQTDGAGVDPFTLEAIRANIDALRAGTAKKAS
jgi:formate dehydrogenase subunit delta